MIVITILGIAASLILLMITQNIEMFNIATATVASLIALLFSGASEILRESYFQDAKENKIVKYTGLLIILIILGVAAYYYVPLWDYENLSTIWGKLFLVWLAIEAAFILFIQFKGDSVEHEDESNI